MGSLFLNLRKRIKAREKRESAQFLLIFWLHIGSAGCLSLIPILRSTIVRMGGVGGGIVGVGPGVYVCVFVCPLLVKLITN